MDDKHKEDVESKIVRIICKNNEEDFSLGTGFFIDNNIVITAAHVVSDYKENRNKYKIKIISKNNSKSYEVDKIIGKENTTISLLKLKSSINGTLPIKFIIGYEIGRDKIYECYGFPSAEPEDGYWLNGKIITNSVEKDNVNWKINNTSNLSSFEGMSGSPVFINGRAIGILQTEVGEHNKVISLGFTDIENIKASLPDNCYEKYSDISRIEDLKKNGYKIETITDMEHDLKKTVKSPYNISLDFFEIDDNNFKNYFKNKLDTNTENIYIYSISKEEALYCILNELLKYNKQVLVVWDHNTWERLNEQVNNFILIPNFYSEDNIISIKNNINIYIYSDIELCRRDDYKELRRRTRATIAEKLRNVGINDECSFLERTNGFYSSLKRELFNGSCLERPEWKEEHSSSFITALLCGKWTDNNYDKKVIEELAGKTYADFINDLTPFMHGNIPFVIMFKNRWNNQKYYNIADIELAWDYLERYVDSTWQKFLNIFKNVITKIDEDFKERLYNTYYASNSTKIQYSSQLKHGMIRSLILKSIYDKNSQYNINQIINNILNNIKCKDDWAYYSQFICDLTEAAPNEILTKLKNSLSEKNALIKLFKQDASNNTIYGGGVYYTNILWAVEKLLFLPDRKYIKESIDWLFNIDAFNIKYKMVNSPKETLTKIFCGWINMIPISTDEKILFAKYYITNYENAWDIIFSELPTKINQAITNMSKPKYLKNDIIASLSTNDIYRTYNEYAKLCIDNIDNKIDRLREIISNLKTFPDTLLDNIIQSYKLFLNNATDIEKFYLMQDLRKTIYSHRYYLDAIWRMNNFKISQLEKMLNEINFNNILYFYLYCIQTTRNSSLILNPIPYNHNKKLDFKNDENYKLYKAKMETIFSHFKDEKLSILELIKLAVKEKSILGKVNSSWQNNIGQNLAIYYSQNTFCMNLYEELLKISDIASIIYAYCANTLTQDNIQSILEKIRDITIVNYGKDLYAAILNIEYLNSNSLVFSIRDKDLEKLYWENWNPYSFIFKAKNLFEKVLNKLKDFNQNTCYIYVLYNGLGKIENDCILHYLKKIPEFNQSNDRKVDFNYYAEEIIKYLEKQTLSETDNKILCNIEFYLAPILDWTILISLQHKFKFDPNYYASIIDKIYKHEDNKHQNTDNNFNAWLELSRKVKFCPGEENKNIDKSSFSSWLEGFKELLKKQEQSNLYFMLIGKLFAHSPLGSDGLYPHEIVRNEIEKLNGNNFTVFKSNYVCEECNKRGAYWGSAGQDEERLALNYKTNADKLQISYPKTAQIYEDLYNEYKLRSASERNSAENEL